MDQQKPDMPVLVGLDGFVDTILKVVKQRQDADRFEPFASMADWAQKIQEAAGYSANFELVTEMVKLGGNGPIMANALYQLGCQTTYIGNLGYPHVHPIFEEFSTRATVYSIAEPGYTDALEFKDGKLMCGKHISLRDINWATLTKEVGLEKMRQLFAEAKIAALVNWTMITTMTDIFEHLQKEVLPKADNPNGYLFFDLADPAKRSREDIALALQTIANFREHRRVVLGLNQKESHQIAETLGVISGQNSQETLTHQAAAIRGAMQIHSVVIHPTQFAVAATVDDRAGVVGPYTADPKITTGGGDHFNAGFILGMAFGLPLEQSLQMAVATSGYYVRNAESPTLSQLSEFLGEL
ncbi:MAG: PfkB family carbohydrate kinase [Verrucomicrobiales bacterium]